MFIKQLNEQDKERIENFDAWLDNTIDLLADELVNLKKMRELLRDREVPANIPFWMEVLDYFEELERFLVETLPMGAEDIFNSVCALLKLD